MYSLHYDNGTYALLTEDRVLVPSCVARLSNFAQCRGYYYYYYYYFLLLLLLLLLYLCTLALEFLVRTDFNITHSELVCLNVCVCARVLSLMSCLNYLTSTAVGCEI